MISTRPLLVVISLSAALAAAQGNRPAQANSASNTIPVLQYQPPPDFMRSGAYSPDDYVSNSFNGSFQVYQFEPFNGNVADAFQRTLLRDRIDILHREQNVVGAPQFQRGQIPGADAVFIANFTENTVGIPHPHMRMVIVASGSVAIVDAATINPTLWTRLAPVVNNVIRTMRVDKTAGPPSLTEGPGPAGQAIAGLYRGIKQKFMTGLTFQASYYTPATHYYLFSRPASCTALTINSARPAEISLGLTSAPPSAPTP